MNEFLNYPLEPFWVFSCFTIFCLIFIFHGDFSLQKKRDLWQFSDLKSSFYWNLCLFTALVILLLVCIPKADIKNIEPYPYIKLIGFILLLSIGSSVADITYKIRKVNKL